MKPDYDPRYGWDAVDWVIFAFWLIVLSAIVIPVLSVIGIL